MVVEIAIKLLWTIVGIAIASLAWAMGIGKFDEPGPGLMSFGLGVLIAAIGFIRLIGQVVLNAPSPIEPWSRTAVYRVGSVIILLMIYVALFEKVGFIVTSFALLLILFAVYSGMRWIWSVPLAATVALANYGLFKLVLGTQLPAGILG